MFQLNRLVDVAMLLAIAFGAAPVTALAQTSSAIEWKVSNGGNGHWYEFNPTLTSWQDARLTAINKGGELASLSNASERYFWMALIPVGSGAAGCPGCTWLGGFQDHLAADYAEPAGGWRWSDGTPWNYTFWNPGEPNNLNGQDFLYASGPTNGSWDDSNGTCCAPFIIEWSADCNGDGIVDYGQILSGALADMNGNNVPDCCESQTWATVLEYAPNPSVVTDANLRAAIAATNLPWRVLDKGTNIEMLLVPGGTFSMGCSPGDTECIVVDETPVHQVTLTQAFYFGKTEVTQGQYGGGTSILPRNLSWNNAQAFCNAKGLRLPTSAEWEFACRAGTTTARYGVSNDIAWYNTNSGGVLHSVATKLPNALGIYDMFGNLSEFCAGWWDTYTSVSVVDPQGPISGTYHVIRGGSYSHANGENRASGRGGANSTQTELHLGFRAARTPTPSPYVINVPSQFATIQAAIDSATTCKSIEVAPGTYNEAIDFKGKAITVKATGARANTIIDGTGLTTSVVRAVTGETSATVLQGFTIRNGAVGSKPLWDTTLLLGGGLYIERANPIIRDCAFTTNHSAYGGGIYALYSNSLVENCTFTQNSASSYGGGIQFFGGSPIIRNCVITNNTCLNRGGGIHLVQWNGGASTLDGCTITGNSTNLGEGGGVSLDPQANAAQKMLVSNCTITNNTAHDKGGGLWATVNPANPKQNVMLNDNTICNNTSVISKRENVWALFEDGGNTICDCLPDVSGDGDVDTGDVSYVLLFFGEPTDADFIQPDQDMSGLIDTADVSLLLLNIGACP